MDEVQEQNLESASIMNDEKSNQNSISSAVAYSEIPTESRNHFSDFYQQIKFQYDEFQLASSTENIVAFFWAAIVFFIGVAFVAAQYTSSGKDLDFSTTYWVLFAFTVLAIIGLAYAVGNRNNCDFIAEDSEDETELNGNQMMNYMIGSAYVFAIGNFLLDMFSIATVFHCSLGDVINRHYFIVKFFFHFARIIFTALQLLFLQIFVDLKVQRSYKLRFKLLVVHVIATNFLIWCTFLCEETGIFSSEHLEHSGEYHIKCQSNPNDTVYATAERMNDFLQPFILQFSLLAASLLYSLCPLKLKIDLDRNAVRRKYNYGAIDTVKRDDSKVYKSDPGLIVGIFLSLLLILSSWSLDDEDHYIYDIRFNYWMQIILQLLMILASIMVLHELKKYHAKNRVDRKYCVEDYLLLITGTCGFLPFLITILFALSKHIDFTNKLPIKEALALMDHQKEVKGILGLLCIVNIISMFTQTYFLLDARSYDRVAFSAKRRDSSYNQSEGGDEHKKLRSAARIGQWLLLLFALNLAFWINDSFFDLRNNLQKSYGIAQAYWDSNTWAFLSKLFYPIIIFYRFHSVAVIAFIWMHLKVKKSKVF